MTKGQKPPKEQKPPKDKETARAGHKAKRDGLEARAPKDRDERQKALRDGTLSAGKVRWR